jgi:bifunctional non-homologous end joining protein LigD
MGITKHDQSGADIHRPQLLGRQATPDAPSAAWVAEEKLDGWRCLARVSDAGAALISRKGTPLASGGDVEDALCELPVDCLLDGELVARDRDGVAKLPLLVAGQCSRQYVVWDVLELEGQDLRPLPLRSRRRLLEAIMGGCKQPLQMVRQLPASQAPELYSIVVAGGGEGIVLKDAEAPYYSDSRRNSWRKVKPANQD